MSNIFGDSESAEELITKELGKTNLSQGVKEILGKRAEEIYQQLKSKEFMGFSKKDKINVANALACDEVYCAIPKQLPKTNPHLRKKARKVTGINPVIEPDARMDKTLSLLENSFANFPYMYPEDATKLSEHTKKIVKDYIQEYNKLGATAPPNSIITVGAAYHIASILFGYRKTQKEISDVLGITEGAFRNYYHDIQEKLKIEIIN